MSVVRVVRHVDCESCTPSTQRFCVICGGNGWVELVVWREAQESEEGMDEVPEIPDSTDHGS